jgi:DNA replication and repair protein RecF
LKIERVHISAFKNLRPLTLKLGAGVNGFWGENGQGKSNFLEALYVTVKGESFRPYSQRSDWMPTGENGALVEILCRDDRGLEYHCRVSFSGSKWEWHLNGKKQSPLHLAQRIPIVVFSPDDHSLIRESPEVRRRFLDTLFVDVIPGYAEVLERFEHALKNRNRLIKQQQKSEVFDYTTEMDSWTLALAREGAQLASLREEVWGNFHKYFYQVATPLFSDMNLGVDLFFERDSIDFREKFDKSKYYQILKNSFPMDMATGWTHRGPHRDDFRIELAGLDSRTKASQGQARLLALSLKWTHAHWVSQERREIPLFLIDDFSNELDTLRRKKLLEMLSKISGQILITGTDSETANAAQFLDYQHFNVKLGEIVSSTSF